MISCVVIFLISWFHHRTCIDLSPGVPVPHADELHDILTARVFENTTDFDHGSVFEYLFGNNTELDPETSSAHLDISILDPQSIKKIVAIARRKNDQIEEKLNNTDLRREARRDNPYLVQKAIDLMTQSLYGTRYRLQATRPFRKLYNNDPSYDIAILYGALMQLRTKMDNMLATMNNFGPHTKFLWYLVMYEKILASTVDVTLMVERMYLYHKTWSTLINMGEPENDDEQWTPEIAERLDKLKPTE